MWKELRRAGMVINEKKVRRLMRRAGLIGRHHRPKCRTTFPGPGYETIPDLVGRRFHPGAPDVAWCQDITYIATGEGWLFLASTLDLGSRRLLGYSMAEHMRRNWSPTPCPWPSPPAAGPPPGSSPHADRGTQYLANDYLEFCHLHQLRPSVGRTGICWDNAVAESFWQSLKRECLQGRIFTTQPKPAGPSSDGSTGTTPPGFTPASTGSPPSSGNITTVKLHNHPSGQRGESHASVARGRMSAGGMTSLPG